MFKIESYITPLLMGYVDRYVKLRHEDFQLSLWGGDAVLNQLDLRLDAIEHAINLPITIKSGHIHELRIHVPWTKLGSEPVVITINTIECILKLRDSAYNDRDSSSSKSSKTIPKSSSTQSLKKSRSRSDENLPPGYIQSITNRIVNNVNIVINNLILKFVEDDIVLSLNVKSAECYAVNSDWARSFIDLTPEDLVLRRMFNFHDLTVCLDKRNASGKIETYQDPLLYRCSLSCRIHMMFDSLNAKIPSAIKFNVLCEKLDLSMTDTQLPMFCRLLELVIALYYGTLELPGLDSQTEADTTMTTETDVDTGQPVEADTPEGEEGEGWGSWAWSYVPAILPPGEEEQDDQSVRKKPQPLILEIGGYITKAEVVFKLSEIVQETTYFGPQKTIFRPFACMEGEAITVEILLKGLEFFNAHFGITGLRIFSQGECVCGVQDGENVPDPYFFNGGVKFEETKPVNYLSNSLFDPNGAENQMTKHDYIFDTEKHLEKYTEHFALQRFGAFWLDYLYTMEQVEDRSMSSRSSTTSVDDPNVKEASQNKFLIGPAHLKVTSSMMHRLKTFLYFANNHEYEPYSKVKEEIVDESRQPPSIEEVKSLEEFIPTRTLHVTFLNSTISYVAADHKQCNVNVARTTTPRKSRKGKKVRIEEPAKPALHVLPALVLQAERLDLQTTSAMYARKLVRMVSKISTPSGNLLHHCHKHIYLKVFGLQVGLACMDTGGQMSPALNLLQPCSFAIYWKTLVLPMYWKNPHQTKSEVMYEVLKLQVNMTRAQAMLAHYIIHTWSLPNPYPQKLLQSSLLEDVFQPSAKNFPNGQPILEAQILGIDIKQAKTKVVRSYNGTVASIYVALRSLESKSETVTPIFMGPVKTTGVSSKDYSISTEVRPDVTQRQNELLNFTAQITRENTLEVPAVFLVNVQGVCASLDPLLYTWLAYIPHTLLVTPPPERANISIDAALARAATPLKNGTSQESVKSSSNLTSKTPSQTPTQTATKSVPKTTSQPTAEKTEGVTNRPISRLLADWFPTLRMLEVQIEIQPCCIIAPTQHIRLPGVAPSIPIDMQAVFKTGEMLNTLVVALPYITVVSNGHKGLDALQEIPMRNLGHSIAGDRLPWTIKLQDASIYSLHSQTVSHFVVKPVSVTSTVAVTTKYLPPTSENLAALGLCVHSHMEGVYGGVGKLQIETVADLVTQFTSTAFAFQKSLSAIYKLTASSKPDTASSEPEAPSIQYPQISANSSSQVEHIDVVITDTSLTETSRAGSPTKDIDGAVDDAGKIKLSLWLQWTLPKLKWKIYSLDNSKREMHIAVCLEDVTLSLDAQYIYTKCHSKFGTINISHFVKSGDTWCCGQYEGTILSCDGKLSRDVEIVTNKLWSSSHQPMPNIFMADSKPRDKAHGFMSCTFTRALQRDVHKKQKKLNLIPDETDEASAEGEKKYLMELVVNTQPCDIVLYTPAVINALKIFNIKANSGNSSPIPKDTHHQESQTRSDLPILTSSNIPLFFLNSSNIRVFIPKCEPNSKENADEPTMESESVDSGIKSMSSTRPIVKVTTEHDMCVMQLNTVSVVPQADNPLPRVIVNKDVYRRALHAGLTIQNGSDVEDRQYQLDISGLSLCTGCWCDFVLLSNKTTNEVSGIVVQNPALEWNTRIAREEREACRLIPIAAAFDLRVVAAPPIVYQPPVGPDKPKQQPILVCGYSLEMNATSDLDFYISTNQLHLLHTTLMNNIQCVTSVQPKADIDTVDPQEDTVTDWVMIEESTTGGDSTPRRSSQETMASQPSNKTTLASMLHSHNFTPFNVLLTAGKISFMVYKHKKCVQQSGASSPISDDLETTICELERNFGGQSMGDVLKDNTKSQLDHETVPYMYAYFSQPHSVISCQTNCQKVELSCYDITIRGPDAGHKFSDESKLIPEALDFPIHWIETRPGEVDSKTGVPPSLYTLTLTGFFNGAAEIQLDIGRPLKLLLSSARLDHMSDIVADIFPEPVVRRPTRQPKPESHSSAHQSSRPMYMQLFELISSVKVNTVQLVAAYDTISALGNAAGVQCGLSELCGSFNLTDDAVSPAIQTNISLHNLLVSTRYCDKSRPLIGPLMANIDVNATWCQHSGSENLPKIVLILDLGAVQMYFGQEHVLCTDVLLKEIQNAFKKASENKKTESKSSPRTKKKAKQQAESPQANTTSEDDLRSERFELIVVEDEIDQKSHEMLPQPAEILSYEYSIHGSLTWCYNEPRVITRLEVHPVPFTLPPNAGQFIMDETATVPCMLQYMDPISHEFLDFRDLHLSENTVHTVDLPPVTKAFNADLVPASVWRIQIWPELQTEEYGQVPEVNPRILLGSIQLDSCFLPAQVPTIQLAIAADLAQLRLSNHFKHLPKDVPSKLHPFEFDSTMPQDQEFAVVTIDGPTVSLAQIQGIHSRLMLDGSMSVQCDVLEYKYLTLQTLLEPVRLELQATHIDSTENAKVECSVGVDPLCVKVGPSTVHTLHVASQAWDQLYKTNGSLPVMNYIIVCNDTQDALRFGQVDTDECVVIQSRQMHSYSWRSHRAQRGLKVCVEGMGWKWSDPFNVDTNGTVVRVIENKSTKATLIIHIKQLSNVQKQITITGQLITTSRLTEHLEVKLLTQKDSRDTCIVVGAKQTAPSFIIEHGEIKGLKVRLMGQKMAWSREIAVTGADMKEKRMIKLQLHDKSQYLHVWCQVFCQHFKESSQYCVLFSPLFVARSRLPQPLFVNVETPRLKSSHQMELLGRGREQQLNVLSGDVTHHLTFQLGPTAKKSSPHVDLSVNCLDQQQYKTVENPSIESICYDWDKQDSAGRDMWPYTDIQSNEEPPSELGYLHSEPVSMPNTRTVLPESMRSPHVAMTMQSVVKVVPDIMARHIEETQDFDQPDIQLNITKQQYWVGCQTILLDVAPPWLLVNHTPIDLTLVESSEVIWHIGKGKTMAPPYLQSPFRLGIQVKDTLYTTDPVELSSQDPSTRRYLPNIQGVLYLEGTTTVVTHIREKNLPVKVCFLTLTSVMKQGLRVITVQPKYQFVNSSQHPLYAACYTIPQAQGRVYLDPSQKGTDITTIDGSNGDTSAPLLFWTLPHMNQSDLPSTDTTDFVQYIILTHGHKRTDIPEFKQWSWPIRIKDTANGTLTTVSVPGLSSETDMTPYNISMHLNDGISFMVASVNCDSAMKIQNNCDVPLSFGQSVMTISLPDTTVHEEMELVTNLPVVPPHSAIYYTYPHSTQTFPELPSGDTGPRLHLSDGKMSSKNKLWSQGIDVSAEQDMFVTIPDACDVKVHIERSGLRVLVTIDPINRAEVSAREIRSRIKGRESSVVTVESPTETFITPPTTPQGSIIASEEKISSRSMTPSYITPPTSPRDNTPQRSSSPEDTQIPPKSAKHESKQNKAKTLSLSLSAFFKQISIALRNEKETVTTEILRASFDEVSLFYYPVKPVQHYGKPIEQHKQILAVCIENIQLDNQLYPEGRFDFPVVMLHQNAARFDNKAPISDTYKKLQEVKERSLVFMEVVFHEDEGTQALSVLGVDISMQPVTLFLEDIFVYDIIKHLDTFIPTKLTRSPTANKNKTPAVIPRAVRCADRGLTHPIKLEYIRIQPMNLLLSVHASLKLYIASDQTPLSFGSFEKRNVYTNSQQLVQTLTMHYASGALFKAGQVVGSLEMLGNPTGLLRNIGTGVADFVRLPYEGLTKGPGAFVNGVTHGMASLVMHISAGTLTSITNFASSVSRNMERLSMDTDHQERLQESRRQRPEKVTDGLKQGLSGFGISLLGAIAGIADQPIQEMTRRGDTERRTSASKTAVGVVAGVGKGLMGVVTKPIGGAAEFVSQTGQGLLLGAGLSKYPTVRCATDTEYVESNINSDTKYPWKMLQNLVNTDVIMSLDASQTTLSGSHLPTILLLTQDILFVVGFLEDSQLQAFSVTEVNLEANTKNASVIYIKAKGQPNSHEKSEVDESKISKDRIAEFIDHTSGYISQGQSSIASCDSQSDVSSLILGNGRYEFHIDPRLRTLFMGQFKIAQDKINKKGFVL
ncbi:unnamed protein product [Owenia fusiformis]|uniref:Chorein N-terminal domain-containing protein n=1 Tax=Owenia fusiformis TaxID=6347 RepID=A0A8J1XZU9_OWEFU|nr:unnamed protein product [Owenia fusiformis]